MNREFQPIRVLFHRRDRFDGYLKNAEQKYGFIGQSGSRFQDPQKIEKAKSALQTAMNLIKNELDQIGQELPVVLRHMRDPVLESGMARIELERIRGEKQGRKKQQPISKKEHSVSPIKIESVETGQSSLSPEKLLELLTPQQTAEILEVSLPTVYRWVRVKVLGEMNDSSGNILLQREKILKLAAERPVDCMRVSEASAVLDYDRSTITEWIRRGVVHGFHWAGALYIPRVEIERLKEAIRATTLSDPSSDLVTVRKAAQEARVGPFTVYQWMKEGTVRYQKIERPRRGTLVSKEDVIARAKKMR